MRMQNPWYFTKLFRLLFCVIIMPCLMLGMSFGVVYGIQTIKLFFHNSPTPPNNPVLINKLNWVRIFSTYFYGVLSYWCFCVLHRPWHSTLRKVVSLGTYILIMLLVVVADPLGLFHTFKLDYIPYFEEAHMDAFVYVLILNTIGLLVHYRWNKYVTQKNQNSPIWEY